MGHMCGIMMAESMYRLRGHFINFASVVKTEQNVDWEGTYRV